MTAKRIMHKSLEIFDGSLVFVLPGSGVALDDCGQIGYKAHNAGDDWHYRKFRHDCGRYECPVCYESQISREAIRAFDRLMEFHKVSGRSILHYVSSPTPREVPDELSYRTLRKECYRIIKRSGIKSGVAIFHYFRHPSHKNDKTEIEAHNPHWHILGDGWIGDRVSEEWIVKRIGIRRSPGQIISTLKYCLRWKSQGNSLYGNLRSPLQFVTWFGQMSYNQLHVPRFVGSGLYCPVCDAEIPKIDWYWIQWLFDPPGEDYGIMVPGKAQIRLGWVSA